MHNPRKRAGSNIEEHVCGACTDAKEWTRTACSWEGSWGGSWEGSWEDRTARLSRASAFHASLQLHTSSARSSARGERQTPGTRTSAQAGLPRWSASVALAMTMKYGQLVLLSLRTRGPCIHNVGHPQCVPTFLLASKPT
eukprot:366227-Chlamydomonas_euryale.AAC.6